MIDHQELWQVFAPNGEAVDGESIAPIESRKTNTAIVGAVHIWFWRRNGEELEVLLQKRSATKPTWPGSLDISVAGHIDVGESLFDAAVREANEEVGYEINVDKLEYIFSYRNFVNGLKWVYLYQPATDAEFKFNDGEVESLEWVKLENFAAMIQRPKNHNLVPHPKEYFSLLLTALEALK